MEGRFRLFNCCLLMFLFSRLLFFGVCLSIFPGLSCKKAWPEIASGVSGEAAADGQFLNYNQGKFFPNIAFERFGVEDGLCSAAITALVQDKKGFLWIGTDSGLNRYDGREFKAWKNDLENPASIPAASIVDMAEDSGGLLWMLMMGKGIGCFDPQNESFQLYGDTLHKLNQVGHTSRILLDSKDRLWFRDGYFDTRERVFKHIESLQKQANLSFAANKTGAIFCPTLDGQLLKFDETRQQFERVVDSLLPIGEAFRRLKIDEKGDFWGATQSGKLHHFNPLSKMPPAIFSTNKNLPADSTQYSFGGTMMDVICSDKTGLVWVAQFGGLTRLDTRAGANPKIFRYTFNENNEFSLPGREATCVLEDRSGVLWVGTMSGGLAKFAPAKQQFNIFQKIPGDTTSLSNGSINAVLEDSKGRLWVATKKHLNLVNPKTGKTRTFKIEKTDVFGCNHPWVTSIAEDPATGKLLLTYWGAGFNWFDPETSKFSKPAVKGMDFYGDGNCWMFLTKALFYSPDTVLLFEWGRSLHLFDKKTGNLFSVNGFVKNGKTLPVGLAVCGLIDHQKNIWIGFDQEIGLLRTRFSGPDSIVWLQHVTGLPDKLSRISGDHSRFLPADFDSTRLVSGTINCLLEDSKQRLWVGTNNGLHRMDDREKGIFKRFGKKQGFPDVYIASILEDEKGMLWVGTGGGLSLFDPTTGFVKTNFDHADGLPGNQFSNGACFKNRRGELFFGGLKGLTMFHPDSLGGNRFSPPAVILKVFADDREVPFSVGAGQVEIPPSTTNIRVEFASLDFTRPESNRYRYQLEGFEKEFSIPKTEGKANYTNVLPGKYQFHLLSANNSSQWSQHGTWLAIHVKPEWWQTWVAKIAGLWLLLGSIYALFKFRERQINDRRDKDLQLKSLQVQTHQAQMNPHFIFNVLTAIKSLVVNRKPEEAGEYLDKFAVLIRRYLDSSVKSGTGSQQRSVVQNEISLAQEIELIDMYVEFEQLKYTDRFDYEPVLQPGLIKENVSVPPMLIQPFVENAIKWGLLNLPLGQKGHLKVSFSLDADDVLTCLVEDDGVGREEAERIQKKSIKHFQSLGKALTEQRVEILNQLGYQISINARDRDGGGTIVEIKIA